MRSVRVTQPQSPQPAPRPSKRREKRAQKTNTVNTRLKDFVDWTGVVEGESVEEKEMFSLAIEFAARMRKRPAILEGEVTSSSREKLSHPESRSDLIGGSEPSLGRETRYWDSLPDFFFLNRTRTCGYGPHLITESKSHIHLQSLIYIYKTELLHLQIRARNLYVVNPYKCVGPVVCGCLLTSSPVPTRSKNSC